MKQEPYHPSAPKPLSTQKEGVSSEDFQVCLRILESLGHNPSELAHISAEDRILLMKAAGRIAHPTIDDNRNIARASRKIHREKRKLHDRALRNSVGIRENRK